MQQDYASEPETAEEIRAFVREYEEGFNKHDAVALAAPCTEDAVQVSPEGPICGRQAIGPFRAWWVTVKDGKGSPYEIQNQFPSLKDFVTDWRDLRRVMRKVEETLRDEYQLIPLKWSTESFRSKGKNDHRCIA
jgi:hypothetical protein